MILHLVGARPNFIKLAPLARAMNKSGMDFKVVHSGQHFDTKMSEVFFRELDMREPEYNLGVNSGTHTQQVARTMLELENVLSQEKVKALVVYGDVNATLAGALVASKVGLPIVHVEAGLRSFDRTMPEEINRIIADGLSDILLTPSLDANQNLINEGEKLDSIHLVGNIMIDTLKQNVNRVRDFEREHYGLVTLHRPSNVDNPSVFGTISSALRDIAQEIPLIFPIHPRTRKNMKLWGLNLDHKRIELLDPMGYLDFLAYQKHAQFVITDSGGIQEETTYLNVPCLVLRESTERPITVKLGSGTLIGFDYDLLNQKVREVLNGEYKQSQIPELWDGNTAGRIIPIIERLY
jgi:UDP-N-acetylglucosamine 2-epimerase (non-hydrolysing)